MEKQQQSVESQVLGGIIMVALIAPLIIWFKSGDSAEEKAQKEASFQQKRCEDSGMALIMSRNFVTRELANPKSAEFLRATGNDYLGDCRHKISGVFDAKNGFGATMRSSYSVTMVYHPESKRWSAAGLVIR